ncbi:hypothetical protein H1C71_024928 [Ictidomys tridecemlineatus]|nr:hypothetical protein H1C71_024928 [Ictidomys tridecemlineatus]KAG3288722.1 hypothetical protein H1C71_024928 [Ictidomys tridecemlineatus]KAG3288723.1 hypothetical protein H1C71_024928 [Ictidomys tridecemlineatus]KAG3288724.1 hypothetical protein H1C71_024928 [Ictidomys tridecemlineatus]KAG3288725.1 hypothetical protein H1C71_024928 [Ictidomys tridecemlineatus]
MHRDPEKALKPQNATTRLGKRNEKTGNRKNPAGVPVPSPCADGHSSAPSYHTQQAGQDPPGSQPCSCFGKELGPSAKQTSVCNGVREEPDCEPRKVGRVVHWKGLAEVAQPPPPPRGLVVGRDKALSLFVHPSSSSPSA